MELTKQEEQLIVTRRKLFAERQKRREEAPKHAVQQVPQQNQGPKQANGWDAHSDVSKPHQGRMTDTHPLFWFEREIFRKITNMQHKEQHDKIAKLLKVPVQNVLKDRVYHGLCHMDALWEQKLLPLKYKHKYEKFKKENGIDETNVHPEQKKLKPDYKFPVPIKNRPFSFEMYPEFDDSEQFVAGKIYEYEAKEA